MNAFDVSVVHPDDHAASKAAFEKAIKTKSPFEIERRLKGAEGTYKWFKTRGTPVLDFEENVIACYGTCTDVSPSTLMATRSTLQRRPRTSYWLYQRVFRYAFGRLPLVEMCCMPTRCLRIMLVPRKVSH